jgi:hypothetical protein
MFGFAVPICGVRGPERARHTLLDATRPNLPGGDEHNTGIHVIG